MSADAAEAALRAWVALVAAGVVREPGAVSVEPVGRLGRNTLVLLLHVAPDDAAYIIGRGGSLIASLRTLVAAAGARLGTSPSDA
jgi:predicted RNA-binding protein YlqC (UPF0109 family)